MEIFENAVNDYVTALDTSVNAHVLIKDGTVFSHFCVLLQMDKSREKNIFSIITCKRDLSHTNSIYDRTQVNQ